MVGMPSSCLIKSKVESSCILAALARLLAGKFLALAGANAACGDAAPSSMANESPSSLWSYWILRALPEKAKQANKNWDTSMECDIAMRSNDLTQIQQTQRKKL
jgi:hypothetical protein